MTISKGYRDQLQALHRSLRWGKDGKFHAVAVNDLANRTGSTVLLDYGCGRSTLKKTLKVLNSVLVVNEYDPGIPQYSTPPTGAYDLVVCTDVLEHVEPEFVDAVLARIFGMATRAIYFQIACRPARLKLPDGRNAHLTVEPPEWWKAKLMRLCGVHEFRNCMVVDTPKSLVAEIRR